MMKYGKITFGQMEAIINKLGGIECAERFLRGELEVVEKAVKKRIIDCDASPFTPEGWEVVEHQLGGEFEWNPSKIELYLAGEQKEGSIEGNELRKKLEGMPVMNACVLDYLLEHQELIPDEWKGKYIYFWGTIYRSPDGDLYVRYLHWRGGEWDWLGRWLGRRWGDDGPAVLRK